MSELAREEIKEAALAVGWNPEYREADETLAWFGPGQRFNDKCADAWPADALALLEAAVREGVLTSFALHYDGDEWTVTPEDQGRWIPSAEDPALPTAAVRAVNQATQTPGAEPREGGKGT